MTDKKASASTRTFEDGFGAESRNLLEILPVAVWVEDLSEVKVFLDRLRDRGVEDLQAHFDTHPEDLAACVSRVRIVDVNDAALALYEASSKAELLAGLDQVLQPASRDQFADALRQFAEGNTRIRFEAENRTLSGRELLVDISIVAAPGHEKDWRRVFVVVADLTQRWLAARALEESEKRYRSLVEDQPELVCRFRPDGSLTYVNRAYAAYFGRTIADLDGFDLFRLLPESDQPALREHLDSFGPDKRVSRIEHQVVRADGSIGWMQWTDRALLDDRDVNVVEFQSIGVDISDLKDAQHRLIDSETRFRSIFEYSSVGIALLDLEGTVLQMNRSFDDLFSAGEGGLVGREFATLWHPEEAQVHEARLGDVLSGRVDRLRQEMQFSGAAGRSIWGLLSASLVRSQSREPQFAIVVVEDLTERRAMEERVRQSEERFREISDNIREVFWLFDWREQQVIYVSPAYEVIWGRSVDSLYENYSQWGESILAEDRDEARRSFERILETGGGESREYRIVRPDGEVRWVSDRGFAIRDEEGEVVKITGIAEDITDRKRMETERRQLEVQVRESQKLESLGLLAGGIAHDFNNLLMGVLGNADLALTSLAPNSPAWAPLQSIETTARRAAELANQMLAYSGRGRFVVETVDLSGIVDEMAALARVSVPKKTTVRFELGSDLPGIEADVTQLRQVVLNLVTNAAEAIGDDHGEISIATGVRECDAEYLAQTMAADDIRPGRFVCVEVADDGAGMSEEVQQRIFDPFFTTKFTGRGLGMAAVLGIVRGHGGAVHVESQPRVGTSIRILFPASDKPKTRSDKSGQSASDAWTGEGTLLLVDDEPVVRGVAQSMLEHLGFEVLVAADGREAVRLFRQHADRIRLVILDLAMPQMSGEEALGELRRFRSDVPVLLSSGYNEQEVVNALSDSDFTGFIQKPYRLAALRERLQKTLS